MAVLQTLVDEVFANTVVEQGVDMIGGFLLDEIHRLFVQGDLVVCCMTPWDFVETFKACQMDYKGVGRKILMASMSNQEVSGLPRV